MPRLNFVVLAEQPDRGHVFAEAVRPVTCCWVALPTESWAELDTVRGVIADVSLNRADARHCLRMLSRRLQGRRMPLVYLTRTRHDAEMREAERLGATACFSALTLPGVVVTGPFRQIAPEKTMTDLLVEHSFGRAETCSIRSWLRRERNISTSVPSTTRSILS